MQISRKVEQRQIQRALDRLDHFIKMQQLQPCIPAFSFCAKILMQYVQEQGLQNVSSKYFHKFKQELQIFNDKKFAFMKPTQQQIVSETFEIIQSDLFLQCLKRDAIESRSSSMIFDRQTNIQSNPNNVVLATKTYSFVISQNILKEGLQKNKKQGSPQKPIQNKANKVENSKQQVEWRAIKNSYQDHKIDETYRLVQQYIKNYDTQNIDNNKSEFIKDVIAQYKMMIDFYKQFDEEGWIFSKSQNGVTMHYKLDQVAKSISIRTVGETDMPIQRFLCIVSQAQLMEKYVPFCYDCRVIKQVSRNSKVATSKIAIPFLTDRQTFFYALGYDRLDTTNSIFLYSRTVNNDKQHMKKHDYHIPQNSQCVRLQYKFYILEYTPLKSGRARIRLASNVDLKLNFLPTFILNMTAKNFAFNYFKKLRQIHENFQGSQWQKAMINNPALYNFFKKKIKEFRDKNNPVSPITMN